MHNSQIEISFESELVRQTNFQNSEKSIEVLITEIIANLEGIDAVELPPLYDCIDPDALNQLLNHQKNGSDSMVAVCFTYTGWNIFVRGDGTIIVGDPDSNAAQTPLF